MSSLSWTDIFIEASQLPFQELLLCWPGLVGGRLSPIGASAFGDLYFSRPSGEVERLDVLEGGVTPVAGDFEEFQSQMNSASWQEENLLSMGVSLLVERGVVRSSAQFYAFAPHPVFTGSINWQHAMAMDAYVWHSICAQVLGSPTPGGGVVS